jgi:phospholipase C
MRRLLLIVAASALVATAGNFAETAWSADRIDHIVVIVEQDHTFDSYFGTYPGARGFVGARGFPYGPRAESGEVLPVRYSEGRYKALESASAQKCCGNGRRAALTAYDGGTMRGFVRAQATQGFSPTLPMLYHDRTSAKGLWELADNFVLFDNYFSASLGGSFVNLLYLISGRSGGYTQGTKKGLRQLADRPLRTVFDELDRANVSWKYYVGGLGRIDRRKAVDGRYFASGLRTPPQFFWAPILAMKRFWVDSGRERGLASQADFYADAARGDLPAVSFVLPSPTDHLPTPPLLAHSRLVGLINAVAKSSQWKRSATFVVWDDWGGFYDHVTPPPGEGFRVPALLVSPFAKHGYVSHVRHSHTSVLNYIIERFGLNDLSTRQASSRNFADAFDFTSKPRTAQLFALAQTPTARVGSADANRMTLVLYLAALEFIILTLLSAWFFRRLGDRPGGRPAAARLRRHS